MTSSNRNGYASGSTNCRHPSRRRPDHAETRIRGQAGAHATGHPRCGRASRTTPTTGPSSRSQACFPSFESPFPRPWRHGLPLRPLERAASQPDTAGNECPPSVRRGRREDDASRTTTGPRRRWCKERRRRATCAAASILGPGVRPQCARSTAEAQTRSEFGWNRLTAMGWPLVRPTRSERPTAARGRGHHSTPTAPSRSRSRVQLPSRSSNASVRINPMCVIRRGTTHSGYAVHLTRR